MLPAVLPTITCIPVIRAKLRSLSAALYAFMLESICWTASLNNLDVKRVLKRFSTKSAFMRKLSNTMKTPIEIFNRDRKVVHY